MPSFKTTVYSPWGDQAMFEIEHYLAKAMAGLKPRRIGHSTIAVPAPVRAAVLAEELESDSVVRCSDGSRAEWAWKSHRKNSVVTLTALVEPGMPDQPVFPVGEFQGAKDRHEELEVKLHSLGLLDEIEIVSLFEW